MGERIVLLTNDGIEGQALAQCMVKAGTGPILIVSEAPNTTPYYSRISRLARGVLGHAAVDRLARLKLTERERRTMAWELAQRHIADRWFEKELASRDIPSSWPAGIERKVIQNVNDPSCTDRINALAPDLLIVFGTGLLKRPLLMVPSKGTLNAHSSILPHYKGPRSEFWQCYNNDSRFVGVSIHEVTDGVDDGALIFQLSTRAEWPSTPYMMRHRNTLAVLEHYPRVAADHTAGRTHPLEQGSTDVPVHRFKDVTMEKRMELMEKLTRAQTD